MRFLLILFSFGLLSSFASLAQTKEHVILCGGPALRKWEDLRTKKDQHDRWWANFIRASTLRMEEIRIAYGKHAKLVWIVYKPGYVMRAREDGKPYTTWIQEQATKRNGSLIWVNSGDQAIRAINSRPSNSIISFDYFGHSNRHCFLLDYGSEIMAASKAWVHEKDLTRIRSRVFDRNAHCQSWGCHTGESMSKYWKSNIGIPLVGAAGKTDYIPVGQGTLPVVMGRWIR